MSELDNGAQINGSLLVVDDEPQVLSALLRFLHSSPYTILTASSAKEALALLEENRVDVVLTDYRMPSYTGIDLCEKIRSRWPSIMLILMTGQIDLPNAQERVKPDFLFGYLLKPWDEQDLVLMLNSALEDKQIVGEENALKLRLEKLEDKSETLTSRKDSGGSSGVDRVLLSQKIVRQKHQELNFISSLITALTGAESFSEITSVLSSEIKKLIRCDEVIIVPGRPDQKRPRILPSEEASALMERPLESLLLFPLTDESGSSIGTLFLVRESGDSFSENDMAIIKDIYDPVTISLSHLKFYEECRIKFEELDATLNSVTDPIFITDRAGGISGANSAARRLSRRKAEDLFGKKIGVIRKTFGDQSGYYLRRYLVHGHREEEPRILECYRDMRDWRDAVNDFSRLEKVASVGRIADAAIREIHGSLGGMLTFTQFLREELPSYDPRQNELRRIEKVCKGALAKINSMEHLFLISSSEPHRGLDIKDIVLKSLTLASSYTRKAEIEVKTLLSDALPKIMGDRYDLQQLFFNIVNNAFQSVLDGGTIIVKSYAGSGNFIHVTVQDNGTGIDKENLPHIFEPFFTTDETGERKGLGLSASYAIVQALGGNITVSSHVGEGATFTVSLPHAGGHA